MSINEMTDCRAPTTNADLDEVERVIGARLPQPYREFLRAHNGGQPSPEAFPFKSGKDGSHLNVFFAVNDPEPMYDLARGYAGWSRQVPHDLLVIAFDAGGSLVTLGIKGERAGKVYFWALEDAPQPPDPASYENVWLVADSFDEFVESFREPSLDKESR